MNREQHLDLILARIDALLALAEKRTPGEWQMAILTQILRATEVSPTPPLAIQARYIEGKQNFAEPVRGWMSYEDAAYIAACSSAAEAGWRATREAIVGLRKFSAMSFPLSSIANNKLDAIRAQWPEHLLVGA